MAIFTNQASLTYNGITTTSNIVTGETTQVITMWKDSAVATYTAGDIITYVLSFQNSGTTEITDLSLTDTLGAYTFNTQTVYPLEFTGDPVLYYLNGILQTTPTITPGPPLVISGLSVLAGSSAVIVFRAQLTEFAPLGTTEEITNTATLSGTQLIDSVTASNTITYDTDSSLTISKALNPTTIVDGGTITYTFTIQNTGPTAANSTANIVISDTFNPILTGLSATLNGTPWASTGNYTYNEATGLFTTIAGQITVPGATYTQDPTTGIWTMTPGITTLIVTGTV